MTDRGVSEVISFVLVFSLIALTVGIVYVGGVGNLEQARDAEQLRNAERAFDVFDDNVDDIVEGNAPHRGTEIKLAGAQLSFGNATELNVTAENATGDTLGPFSVNLRPIVYHADGPTELVYEGGSIIRSDRSGAIVLEDPPLTFDEDLTLLQYVQTRKLPGSSDSVGGEETVLVRTTSDRRAVLGGLTGDPPYVVTFNVTTNRTSIWEATLEDHITSEGLGTRPDPCQIHENTVECTFETETLYVSVTRIDVAFS